MATWYKIHCDTGPHGAIDFSIVQEQGKNVPRLPDPKLAEDVIVGDKICSHDGYGLQVDSITPLDRDWETFLPCS